MIKRIDTHQVFAALLALFLAAAAAHAASLDCAKAATRAEKTICADPGHARDKNPPDVDALIGIRIPPVIPTIKSGSIPGWISIGGTSINDLVSVEQIYGTHHSAIAVIWRDKSRSSLIVDAKALPPKLLTYDIINNRARLRRNWQKYYSIGSHCERNDGASIVGLMRPEPGRHNCNHESRQIIKAWQVDSNGKLRDMQPTGVQCYFDGAENDCSN